MTGNEYYSNMQDPYYIPTLGKADSGADESAFADTQISVTAQPYYNFLAHDYIPDTRVHTEGALTSKTKILTGVSRAYDTFLELGYIPGAANVWQGTQDPLAELLISATLYYQDMSSEQIIQLANTPHAAYDPLDHDCTPNNEKIPLTEVAMSDTSRYYYNFLAHDHIPDYATIDDEEANIIRSKILESVAQTYTDYQEIGYSPYLQNPSIHDPLEELLLQGGNDYQYFLMHGMDQSSVLNNTNQPQNYVDALFLESLLSDQICSLPPEHSPSRGNRDNTTLYVLEAAGGLALACVIGWGVTKCLNKSTSAKVGAIEMQEGSYGRLRENNDEERDDQDLESAHEQSFQKTALAETRSTYNPLQGLFG